MPLGDGAGPPDGTGPMTGRRRFGDKCPSLTGTVSWRSMAIRLLAGAALLALTLALRRLGATDRQNT